MKQLTLYIFLFISICFLNSNAEQKNSNNEILKNPTKVYDMQKNTISNIDFYNTNYGIFGLNIYELIGGLKWPRGSTNQYLFASGFWFGAQKRSLHDDTVFDKFVTVSYDPNNGSSMFGPGRVDDQDEIDISKLYLYRTYYSTDFDLKTGQPKVLSDGPAWPLWGTQKTQHPWSITTDVYESDSTQRNLTTHPTGPIFISDEDIFCTYKDTDETYLSPIDKNKGYPLRLQVDQRILTWNEHHALKNCAIIQYVITNKSQDTLRDCVFAHIFDLDIGSLPGQADNDRLNYYWGSPSSNINFVYGWTETNKGELGKGFGYFVVSLLETPAIDFNGFLRKGQSFYNMEEQIGHLTFRNWNIYEEFSTDESKYDFISAGIIDGDTGPNDKRILISTGEFHLLPDESVRIALLITLAMPCKDVEADGSYEDIECTDGLVDNVRKAIEYYYNWETSINDSQLANNDFLIFPNPAINYIELNLQNPILYEKIYIYNSIGELVKTDILYSTTSIYKINIEHLSSGVYFVRIGEKTSMFVKY